MTHIGIFGCGPAGLLAAHAVSQLGHRPVIIAKRIAKSPVSGAQYLHAPIPGINLDKPDGYINYRKIGTKEGYAEKVYGSPNAPCSWDQFATGEVGVWDMKKTYDWLWRRYSNWTVYGNIDQEKARDRADVMSLIISTIPRWHLCIKPINHTFKLQPVWIVNGLNRGAADNEIIYNGDPMVSWYRTSRIFGHDSTEYTISPGAGAVEGFKPISTDCDCQPNIVKAGRFGLWQKGQLVHHAYQHAFDSVREKVKESHEML